MKQALLKSFCSLLLILGMNVSLGTEQSSETSPESTTPPQQQSEEAKDTPQELSLARQIAGYAVLAFLIGWMFWNSNRKSKEAEESDDSDE
jgi:hypothetical protein